jgi:hypothetical protein
LGFSALPVPEGPGILLGKVLGRVLGPGLRGLGRLAGRVSGWIGGLFERGAGGLSGEAERVLNIGSGSRPLEGAINLDIVAGNGVDVVGDARALPFDPETIHRVVAERLPSLLGADPKVATEIYRVLVPGGSARLTSLSGFGPGAVQAFKQAGFRSVQATGTILNLVK